MREDASCIKCTVWLVTLTDLAVSASVACLITAISEMDAVQNWLLFVSVADQGSHRQSEVDAAAAVLTFLGLCWAACLSLRFDPILAPSPSITIRSFRSQPTVPLGDTVLIPSALLSSRCGGGEGGRGGGGALGRPHY